MIELPTKKTGVTRSNPRFMVIFGKPKSGKTTALSMLENNLIIDLEKGAAFVDALKVEPESTKDLLDLVAAIKEAGKPYKYITLDTATALEDDYVMKIATKMYQSTIMGANYKGDDLRKLPNGAGQIMACIWLIAGTPLELFILQRNLKK